MFNNKELKDKLEQLEKDNFLRFERVEEFFSRLCDYLKIKYTEGEKIKKNYSFEEGRIVRTWTFEPVTKPKKVVKKLKTKTKKTK